MKSGALGSLLYRAGKYRGLYIFFTLTAAAGFVSGIVFSFSYVLGGSSALREAFRRGLSSAGSPGLREFFLLCFYNLQCLLIIWLGSLHVVLFPLIPCMVFYRSFEAGAAAAVLWLSLSVGGFLYWLIALAPPAVLCILVSIEAARIGFCLGTNKSRPFRNSNPRLKRSLQKLFILLPLFLPAALGTLWQIAFCGLLAFLK